ncbi:hypothetical protein N7465_011465 [Penicillium sp. CMV-2018d]|nr:hypothetical protein N7465_011465 [Penicillium sp. CMV-2018d]
MPTVQSNFCDTTSHPGLQRFDSLLEGSSAIGVNLCGWSFFIFSHGTILPAIRAWQMLGEIILVLGLSSDNRLKRPFVSPATQYLG